MLTKKIKYIFGSVLLLGAMLFATPAFAALVNCKSDPCSWGDLITLMNDVINFLIFTLGVPLITIVIVVSGVQLVWSHDQAAYGKAKSRLTTALLGLLIMLSAYLIVKAVVWGLTGDKPGVENSDFYNLRGNLPTDPTSQ